MPSNVSVSSLDYISLLVFVLFANSLSLLLAELALKSKVSTHLILLSVLKSDESLIDWILAK